MDALVYIALATAGFALVLSGVTLVVVSLFVRETRGVLAALTTQAGEEDTDEVVALAAPGRVARSIAPVTDPVSDKVIEPTGEQLRVHMPGGEQDEYMGRILEADDGWWATNMDCLPFHTKPFPTKRRARQWLVEARG